MINAIIASLVSMVKQTVGIMLTACISLPDSNIGFLINPPIILHFTFTSKEEKDISQLPSYEIVMVMFMVRSVVICMVRFIVKMR